MTYIQYIGFPDGYVTELESARKVLFKVFTLLSAALGIIFFLVGLSASKPGMDRRLKIAILIFNGLIILSLIVNYFMGSCLDNGRGG